MNKIVIDCTTGQIARPNLTAGEIAQQQADAQAAATQAAADAQAAQDAAAARALVVQVAQSAVGVRFDQLNATQVRALAAILFWRAGALTKDGVVRPLADWVHG